MMERRLAGCTIVDHPLIKSKVTILRNKETPTEVFRRTLHEVTALLAFEAINAEAILDEAVTDAVITEALAALNAAIAVFQQSVIPAQPPGPLDRTLLDAAIAEAEALYDSTTGGSKVGQYAPEDRGALLEAIEAAVQIRGAASSQSAVDQCQMVWKRRSSPIASS